MSDHIDFRGGEFIGPVVGKAEYRQRVPAPTALDALPAKVTGFTGRDVELERLRDALNPAASSSGPQAVLVTAVSGLGGIGKTALAVEAAYAAREKGWFPGGVLFVDLHGYDDAPVTAHHALQSLLRALGIEPEHIPATADERAALYRSVLAERDGVLILADNASAPEQVRPLLPGGSRHRVLVTSRDRLLQLGARLMRLEQLTPEASYDLLDLALRIADAEDNRVVNDPELTERLVGLCGQLPLALQIAAALLAEDATRSVAELVAELTDARDRLDQLDDGERSVRAAFDLSYRRLPPGQAQLLRLLALAPGPEVSNEVAAVLVGTEAPPARDLKLLARAHLVERGSGAGRWRMHDLVRMFGMEVAAETRWKEEGESARWRVLAYYHLWADAADDRLLWLPGTAEPALFADRAQALAWLDAERSGLVAAVQWGQEERYANAAILLASSLGEYLRWRRYYDDWIIVATTARQAAQCVGDQVAEAFASNNLGLAFLERGGTGEAINALRSALSLYRFVKNPTFQACAWDNLGLALVKEAGRTDEAIDAHTQAIGLFQVVGNRSREAVAWNNLGGALQDAGRMDEAIEAHIHARDLFQAAQDQLRAAKARANIARALQLANQPEEAIESYANVIGTLEKFEDWYHAGQVLVNWAVAHEAVRDLAEAHARLSQAAVYFTRANAPERAGQARARAAALTAPKPPAPTDRPTPASPPARTPESVPLSPPPPGVPGSGGP